MPCYEHVFIARANLSAQRIEGLIGDFSAVIKKGGGEVARTEYWGLRNLAYRIGKNRRGHYALLNIEAPHAALAEMERQMRLHEDIVRFLSVRVEALNEEPSPPMRQRLTAEAGRAESERSNQPEEADAGLEETEIDTASEAEAEQQEAEAQADAPSDSTDEEEQEA